MRLHFLRLRTEFAEMFIGQGTLEIVGILLTLLFGAEYQAYFLNATLDQLLEKNQDYGSYHSVGAGYREKVFLQGTSGWIEASAEAGHRNNGTTHRMNRLERQGISLHSLSVEVFDQSLLVFLTSSQKLY